MLFRSNPLAQQFGKSYETHRTLKTADELRILPEVVEALDRVDRGGFPEAVIRMLIMLADSRGSIRKDRLERSGEVLNQCNPFAQYSHTEKNKMIQEQTLIVSFANASAINTLPLLLVTHEDRTLALQVLHFIVGNTKDMTKQTHELIDIFHEILEVPKFDFEIETSPLEIADLESSTNTMLH